MPLSLFSSYIWAGVQARARGPSLAQVQGEAGRRDSERSVALYFAGAAGVIAGRFRAPPLPAGARVVDEAEKAL